MCSHNLLIVYWLAQWSPSVKQAFLSEQSLFSVNSFHLLLVSTRLWLSWVSGISWVSFTAMFGFIETHLTSLKLSSCWCTCFLIFHLFFHISTFNCREIFCDVVFETYLHLSKSNSFIKDHEQKSGWESCWSSQAAVLLSDSYDRPLPIFLYPVSLIPFSSLLPSLSLSFLPSFFFVPRLSLGQQELPSSSPRPVKDSGRLWGGGGIALY